VPDTTIVNRPQEDTDFASGLEEQAAKLRQRARRIAAEIDELESEHATAVEGYEYLQKAIAALRRGEGRFPTDLPPLDVPIRRRYPQGYPTFHAIVDTLSRGDALHRSEIVARLTEMGFPWGDRDPARTVGSTLGRNRGVFEEVGRHKFRLRPTDRAEDELSSGA
jgi:hypothetical protein